MVLKLLSRLCGFIVLTASLSVIVSCIGAALGDNLDAVTAWAEKTTPLSWQRGGLRAVQTTVVDHFGRIPYDAWTKRGQNGLGYPGLTLPTAGVGSSWVYDSKHHIAGGTQYNDDGGWDDLLAYSSAPPSNLPSRDLSTVVSSRGLRLGTTMRQAADALGVSVTALQTIDAHHTALSVIRVCTAKHDCGPQAAKTAIADYFAVVVFSDGRAVYIQEGVDGRDGM